MLRRNALLHIFRNAMQIRLQQKFELASSPKMFFSSFLFSSNYSIVSGLSRLFLFIFTLFSHVEFSIFPHGRSWLSFSVDLNFFQSESIFYFLPLLSSLFLRRNTVTCKLDFLMHIDIERKSCIVISHVCIWAYVTPRKSTCTPVLPN